jgi:glucokinase
MSTLAVDFGGRRIKLGLVADGVVIAQAVFPSQADQPLRTQLGTVADALKQLCEEQGTKPGACAGVAFAYPSIIDVPRARILDHFDKFGDAASLDLRAWAHEQLGLPLAIDNDARMALAGEWCHGAGAGCQNVVMVTLGTGLGVSAVIEGHLLRGVHGQAGILGGHLTANYNGSACVCGNIGCAEAEASTWALPRLTQAEPRFAGSALSREPALDFATVFRLAAQGDPCSITLRDHCLRVWSALAVSLIHAYDPELLILGGGVMGSADKILPAIRDYVGRHAHTPWGKVRIAASTLGDRAALLGCEWLLREQHAKEVNGE